MNIFLDVEVLLELTLVFFLVCILTYISSLSMARRQVKKPEEIKGVTDWYLCIN